METNRCRLLADAEYFESRISKLEGAGDLGDNIVNLIKAKPIISESGEIKTSVEKSKQSEDKGRKEPTEPAQSNEEKEKT